MWGWVLASCVGAPESPAIPCDADAVDGESGRVEGFTVSHNEVRASHGVPDLAWDPALAQVAADWIGYLADQRGCALEHDLSSALGENLGWNSGFQSNPCHVVYRWAEEEQFYDLASASCEAGADCGHFTQLVWETTERVGCAMTFCAPEDDAELLPEIWMCAYEPAGNVPGQPPY